MQRIENFWNFVWAKFASYFKGVFQNMERAHILDRYHGHAGTDGYAAVATLLSVLL